LAVGEFEQWLAPGKSLLVLGEVLERNLDMVEKNSDKEFQNLGPHTVCVASESGDAP
jgi:hypothetical protein